MFLVFGVSDSGYVAELQYKRYHVAHEITRYKDEHYSTESLGAGSTYRLTKWVSFVGRGTAGYEHHYQSKYYGSSYMVFSPEIGVQTHHDFIGLQLSLTPSKYFYRISKEKEHVTQKGFRTEPVLMLSIRFNLENSLKIPSSIYQSPKPQKKVKK